MSTNPRPSPDRARTSASQRYSVPGGDSTNLADLLERVLDKGIVVAGDITLYLGQIELLTLKIRLLVASVDKAQEIGINWWESDPALSSGAQELKAERDQLKERLQRVEEMLGAPAAESRETREDSSDEHQQFEERIRRLEEMANAPAAEEKPKRTRRKRAE